MDYPSEPPPDSHRPPSAIVHWVQSPQPSVVPSKNQTKPEELPRLSVSEEADQILAEIRLAQNAVRILMDTVFPENPVLEQDLRDAVAQFESFVLAREEVAKIKPVMTEQSKVIRAVMVQSFRVFLKSSVGQMHDQLGALLERVELAQCPLLAKLLKDASMSLMPSSMSEL